MRPLFDPETQGSILDLSLDRAGSLGQVATARADILADTLDGVAGGERGGDDDESKDGEDVFHGP